MFINVNPTSTNIAYTNENKSRAEIANGLPDNIDGLLCLQNRCQRRIAGSTDHAALDGVLMGEIVIQQFCLASLPGREGAVSSASFDPPQTCANSKRARLELLYRAS